MKRYFIISQLIILLSFLYVNFSLGQVHVTYKIYCSDINKREIATDKIIAEKDNDIIDINIYSNKTVLSSQQFGWTMSFSYPSWHNKQTKSISNSSNNIISIIDIFFDSNDQKLIYTRPKKGKIMPLLQISQNDYYYSYNVDEGQIFDNNSNRWIVGKASQAFEYEDDEVRNRIRKDIGRFCDLFEYEMYERVNIGNDPWFQSWN